MLLTQLYYLFHDLLIHIHLDDDRIRIGKDLVTLFLQNVKQRHQIRSLGNRSRQIAVVIKHCQSGSHAIGRRLDIFGIYLMVIQLADNCITQRRLIHNT